MADDTPPARPGAPMPLDVGRVVLLRRFPLRSAGGELPGRALVTAAGLDGDRRHVVTDAAGRVLTARDVPALAGVAARLDDRGGLVVDTPIDDLAAAAGQPLRVALAASSTARHSGGAAVHVVSDGAADAPDAPAGCDPGERANVVLALGAGLPPGAERTWAGGVLRIGEGGAELVLTRVPSRCLGVYADVAAAGWVGVGDRVQLLPPPVDDRADGHDRPGRTGPG